MMLVEVLFVSGAIKHWCHHDFRKCLYTWFLLSTQHWDSSFQGLQWLTAFHLNRPVLHFNCPWPLLSLWHSGPRCLNQATETLCWYQWYNSKLVHLLSFKRVLLCHAWRGLLHLCYSLVGSPRDLLFTIYMLLQGQIKRMNQWFKLKWETFYATFCNSVFVYDILFI